MDLLRARPDLVSDLADRVALDNAGQDPANPTLVALMNEDERDKIVAACYSAAVKYDELRVDCLNMNPSFKQIAEAFDRQSRDIRAIAAKLNELG